MRFVRLLWVVVLSVSCLAGPSWRAHASSRFDVTAESPIPVLPGLRTQIDFWKDIFTTYSTHQVVIHDTWHLDRVYRVLDFRPLDDSGLAERTISAANKKMVEFAKDEVRRLLKRLHAQGTDTGSRTPEERKIAALFGDAPDPSEFLRAAAEDRIRAQTGLRERFAAGLDTARSYWPEMERIFEREGLPVELTRLPLIESCFNIRAYSKAGAAGIWQFMPSTGRLFMRVDRAVDERRDPITSTEAAAKFLKRNYETLGNWPLAVTAYNHGPAGIARAISQVGSRDLMDIIARYQGRTFKFASRNFYAEFLAALEAERHGDWGFDDDAPELPATRTITLPHYVNIKSLARSARTGVTTLADLNPALSSDVVKGKLLVPKGYRLRIPASTAENFRTRYAALAAAEKQSSQKQRFIRHKVRRGQTLSGIARRYGTTIDAIQRTNRISKPRRLRAGQSLLIPSG